MARQDQDREVAVERVQEARERRDERIGRQKTARRASKELAAYAQLHAAVEQFAAREAWLDRGP